MLGFNRSLLNRVQTLRTVLKAWDSINSMRILHVIFLSKITPRYFILFINGMFRSFSVRLASGGLCPRKK
jgi:hypothetical protein